MLRKLVKTVGANGLHAAGADRLIGRLTGRGGRRPLVLCYHRVVEDVREHPLSAPAMLVSQRTLEAQLDWVGRRYDFVGLDEIGRRLEAGGGGRRARRPLAAVTFDDGYADVYHNGFPLLRRKGIPFAVFVVTGVVDTHGPHLHDELYVLLERLRAREGAERLVRRLEGVGIAAHRFRPGRHAPAEWLVDLVEHLLRSLPRRELLPLLVALRSEVSVPGALAEELRPMTWPMVVALHESGVTVGSHTRSHPILPNEGAETIRAELASAKRALEERLGGEVRHLAYPDGQFCPTTVEAAHAAGYRYAYTCCAHGLAGRPLLTIQRRSFWERSSVGLSGRFSPAIAACQVQGVLDLARPCRLDHRRRRPARPRRGRKPQEVSA